VFAENLDQGYNFAWTGDAEPGDGTVYLEIRDLSNPDSLS